MVGLGIAGLFAGWSFFAKWADLGWSFEPLDVFHASYVWASWIASVAFISAIPYLKAKDYYLLVGTIITTLLSLLLLWSGSIILDMKIGYMTRPLLAWALALAICAIFYYAYKQHNAAVN